jgi:hypothetical protein
MIRYISNENCLAVLPTLIDATLNKVVTVFANGLSIAKLDGVELPINVLSAVTYSVVVPKDGILELTDIDETATIQIYIEPFNATAYYSWLQRNQLLYLKLIFESKGNEWLKRFALYAKDINNTIGTYRAIDIVMQLLDIRTYKLERHWHKAENDTYQWLAMTDDSLVNDETWVPTGNLKLSFVSNFVIFENEEILQIVRHVLPAVNFIEDISSTSTSYNESELYVASQESELTVEEIFDDSALTVSAHYTQRGNQKVFHASSDYPFVLLVAGRQWFMGPGQHTFSINTNETELPYNIYTLLPTANMEANSGTITELTNATVIN